MRQLSGKPRPCFSSYIRRFHQKRDRQLAGIEAQRRMGAGGRDRLSQGWEREERKLWDPALLPKVRSACRAGGMVHRSPGAIKWI